MSAKTSFSSTMKSELSWSRTSPTRASIPRTARRGGSSHSTPSTTKTHARSPFTRPQSPRWFADCLRASTAQ
eukprot:118540-Amorphochlora_amoeboformis.AAC.1